MNDMIKFLKDTIPWIIGLSFLPKLIVSFMVVGLVLLFLVLIWTPENKNLNKNQDNIISKDGIQIQLAEHWLNMSSLSVMIGTRGDTALYTEPDWRINSFFAKGKNNRENKIEKVQGYIESIESKRKINILVDGYNTDKIYGIPSNADFYIKAIFPKSTPEREGLTFEDFWRDFGAFDLYLDFDGTIITKQFNHKEIINFIDNYIASLPKRSIGKPRVERK